MSRSSVVILPTLTHSSCLWLCTVEGIPRAVPRMEVQAPRLHAILARKQTSPLPVLSPDVAAVAAALPALRLTALELLGTALGGDMLAAEYLLLQLVSRCAWDICKVNVKPGTRAGPSSLGPEHPVAHPYKLRLAGRHEHVEQRDSRAAKPSVSLETTFAAGCWLCQ